MAYEPLRSTIPANPAVNRVSRKERLDTLVTIRDMCANAGTEFASEFAIDYEKTFRGMLKGTRLDIMEYETQIAIHGSATIDKSPVLFGDHNFMLRMLNDKLKFIARVLSSPTRIADCNEPGERFMRQLVKKVRAQFPNASNYDIRIVVQDLTMDLPSALKAISDMLVRVFQPRFAEVILESASVNVITSPDTRGWLGRTLGDPLPSDRYTICLVGRVSSQ